MPNSRGNAKSVVFKKSTNIIHLINVGNDLEQGKTGDTEIFELNDLIMIHEQE